MIDRGYFFDRNILSADKNLYWTAIVFFIGLLLLGAIWWKALMVAAVAFICWYLTYGRQLIIGVGLFVLFLGFAVWLGLIMPPAQWSHSPVG